MYLNKRSIFLTKPAMINLMIKINKKMFKKLSAFIQISCVLRIMTKFQQKITYKCYKLPKTSKNLKSFQNILSRK